LFSGATDELNFRCTSSGVKCTDSPDLTKPGLRADCEPNDASEYLEPVDRYVDFVRSLKNAPSDSIIVAGILGRNEPFEIKLDDKGKPTLGPSCTYGGNQTAVPALRTAAFLDGFENRVQREICGADLSQAMIDIAAYLKRLIGDPCWIGEIADQDLDTDGLQPDCQVTDVRVLPDGTREDVAVIAACGNGTVPCWRLEEDAVQCSYTSTHLKLVIDRGGVLPPSDIHVKASCVTTAQNGPFM
jgi:hypothetical protein